MDSIRGIIIKGIGGFYYVKTAIGLLESKPKGIFRKQKTTPLAGDEVLLSENSGDYTIVDVLPRKSRLLRPPVANVDLVVIVVSASEPDPVRLIIDRLTVSAQRAGIKTAIAVTKTDLKSADSLIFDYKKAGFKVLDMSLKETQSELLDISRGKLTVFAGNSGVGKSTLINMLCPGLDLETGEISRKLGRGRHTTRAVELYEWNGGYIADTPGFSSVDFESDPILKEELAGCFAEFDEYADGCYFTGCSHTCEKGCALREALDEGKIVKSRYDSYCTMYKEAKEAEQNRY